MRSAVRLFACLTLLLFGGPAWALTNGGFESTYAPVAATRSTITGSISTGWTDNSSWADVTVDYSRETTNPHTGAACQRVVLSAVKSGELQLIQPFSAKAGRLYTAGVWLRGTPGATVYLAIRLADAPYTTLADMPATLKSSWSFVSIPSHIIKAKAAVVMIHAVRPVDFCIDDASLKDAAGAVTADPLARPALRNFGMHIENYLDSKGPKNLNLEGFTKSVNSPLATVTGQIGAGWFDNSEWADVAVTYAAIANAHAGKRAQRMVVSRITSGNVQAGQFAYLRSGSTYEASIWLRGSAGMRIGFAIRKWGDPFTDYAAKDLTATGSWQQVKVQGQVSGSGVSVLLVRAYQAGTLDFDDARLTTSSGAIPNLALPWPVAPVGAWRLWDQEGTTWAKLEPSKGQWDFTGLDAAVNDATTHGAEIVLTLGQSPTWASARPAEASTYGGGAAAEPRDTADWVNYLRTVATRYKGKIFYYEIWNEPNDPTFYTGSVEKLAELTKLARSTLKQVDSRIQIIGASPYITGYLQKYLKAGAASQIDIVGYHIYNDPPEDDARILADLRTIRANAGLAAKPLWITEGATGNASTPELTATGLVARKYLIQYLYGARRFFWYNWGPGHSLGAGLTKANPATAANAGKGLKVLQAWLIGAQIRGVKQDNFGNYVTTVTTAAGKTAYIIWNPAGGKVWTAPDGFNAFKRFGLAGNVGIVSGSRRFIAGKEPVMIVER